MKLDMVELIKLHFVWSLTLVCSCGHVNDHITHVFKYKGR
jgi:hypothetical protein